MSMRIQDFICRNEGELVGTIGAFIAAIFTALLASYLTKKNIERKDKKNYNSILTLIHTELGAQKHHLFLLKNSLKELRNASIANKNFPIEELPMKLDLSILDYAIFKIYEYKNFNNEIAALLVHYRNSVKGLNRSLEFKGAIKMIEDGMNEIENTIDTYFNVLNAEFVNKMEIAITKIKKLIEEIIDDKSKLTMMLEK